MPHTTTDQNSEKSTRELVSRSTILILSGFLVGLGTSHGLDPAAQARVFCAAGTGFLAYVGLDLVARRRRQTADREAHSKATRQLERRIGRHVGRLQALAQEASGTEPQHDPVLFAVMSRHSF
jgi:C4-dicarboxylate-specific signal transduction histidine kinase